MEDVLIEVLMLVELVEVEREVEEEVLLVLVLLDVLLVDIEVEVVVAPPKFMVISSNQASIIRSVVLPI